MRGICPVFFLPVGNTIPMQPYIWALVAGYVLLLAVLFVPVRADVSLAVTTFGAEATLRLRFLIPVLRLGFFVRFAGEHRLRVYRVGIGGRVYALPTRKRKGKRKPKPFAETLFRAMTVERVGVDLFFGGDAQSAAMLCGTVRELLTILGRVLLPDAEIFVSAHPRFGERCFRINLAGMMRVTFAKAMHKMSEKRHSQWNIPSKQSSRARSRS